MAKNDWKKKVRDMDDFLDLDLLIDSGRKKSDTKVISHAEFGRSDDGINSLYEVNDSPKETSTCIKRYVIPEKKVAYVHPEREFKYENSLIHEVKIFEWSAGYNYYEDFYRDVKKYFNVIVEDAEDAEFFSYVPQYSQMDLAQKNRYFYFRTRARRGEFIRVDYSYVLLYCFELISSVELMDASEALAQLTLVWKNYHKIYPQINKYLSEWICDFGLINGIEFPSDLLGAELSELMRGATLKEYYASGEYNNVGHFVDLIIEFCSAYNYRQSRYYEKYIELYDGFITKALNGAFDEHLLYGFTAEGCNVTRQTFIGAIAPRQIKKRIQVEYCSFSRTNEFRYVVGDVIKYCENKIREHSGIKSRLSVYSIDESIKKYIDLSAAQYFANIEKPQKVKKAVSCEYDALYDIPKKEFSLADAKKIENASWKTTQMLVDAFAEPACDEDTSKYDASGSVQDKSETSGPKLRSPLYEYRELLSLILSNDAQGQRDYARASGHMLEYLADEINSIGAELYGDVLLEEVDGAYAPIEDYISLIEKEVENG